MPPRKTATTSTTTKPTSDDTKACSIILNYLVSQNRPYSATEISSNLHNAVTKARTDKLLKEMFERGEIAGKASGKQWVFWGLQVCLLVWGEAGRKSRGLAWGLEGVHG
jgi:26S proteasome regulatory subunit (ATPase 3-interacting protein)